ncbi:hypothetical protein SDC9_67246 [bioreactor metagenome]|uniref:Uncharacterized protein n=1 Tax=bioreactor metagenome TaxID=1076179 RepID=A0A644XX73_9ZZZZ
MFDFIDRIDADTDEVRFDFFLFPFAQKIPHVSPLDVQTQSAAAYLHSRKDTLDRFADLAEVADIVRILRNIHPFAIDFDQ